ncbi:MULTISPECIES: hypothetical protein [unclassified Adlercreutzia]|uniref:hypothetical protein n=1 Tax=unclassified Adlercreutzia TaxID=2636013 RepID=UPI001F150753|nr:MULTISPECIES: hypothetical protein [unclassified Adlercreutzia]
MTEEGSSRAHDLVDLQVQIAEGEVNLAETRVICERLFNYRKLQSWPPVVTRGEDWESLYADAALGLQVLPTVDEAIDWANRLIESIDAAK